MTSDISFDAWVTILSMVVVLCSYALICYTDRSWLNWASPGFIVTLGGIFVFPLTALLENGPVGSRFAYFYCYLTYALTNVCTALAYLLTRRIRDREQRSKFQPPNVMFLPWALLLIGILFYAPILIRFSSLILHPRDIYSQTRVGYGPLVFGSRAFLNLAFVLFLFKQSKSLLESVAFYVLCVGVVYTHGSKGLLLNLLSTALLYWIYVKGKRIGLLQAAVVTTMFIVVLGAVFTLFADLSDLSELAENIQGYADYTKNAMVVIDDPDRAPAWGRLTMEGEVYARVPRFLFPNKPSNFGIFSLAEHYYPASYRADAGNPDFNIGMQYADFGVLAVVYLCITSSLTGIMTGWCIRVLRARPTAPNFILLLFFSGTAIISFGTGYALPESILLALLIWVVSRSRGGTSFNPPALSSPAL